MRRSIKLKEALFWVILAGVAAHASIWLIHKSAVAFYETSVYRLTGTDITKSK